MGRKKIVLLIVEGASDDTALGVCMDQVFDANSVLVLITHGDITTRRGIIPGNIIARLGNDIKIFASLNHFKKSDFRQIIHIADTDGTYIPDNAVVHDSLANSPIYQSDGIHTNKVKKIIERNEAKRNNLLRLRNTTNIWGIPYRIYYMSANLDHVLYNKLNSTNEEKENDSYAFAETYENNVTGFISFICESDFSVAGDIRSSWNYIEQGMNSIQRHSNLGICIQEELS